jgi:PadR family transcriptional regulator PadR
MQFHAADPSTALFAQPNPISVSGDAHRTPPNLSHTSSVYSICGYDSYRSPDVGPRAQKRISKLIEARSSGQLKFHVASLYPLLYRLEERGWLQGKWVEKPGQRRRRFYGLTAEGRRVLARQRDTWKAFVDAMRLITGVDHA